MYTVSQSFFFKLFERLEIRDHSVNMSSNCLNVVVKKVIETKQYGVHFLFYLNLQFKIK